MSQIPEPLLEAIRGGNRFLLTSHINPDGDAIGSELGLARLLRQMGKGATIWNRDPSPRVYAPLPGCGRIHVGDAPPAGFPDSFSAVVLLECPSPERCGLQEVLACLPWINIDHHLGNDHYGKINWVDVASPAVGEMVFRLARALHLELDLTTADLLYLTLVTDTGGFRFSNATATAFEAAAELVRHGARPEKVSGWIYESLPESSVRLLGAMLQTLELHAEGRLATVWLTQEMFAAAGAGSGDSEGLIDTPRSIAGVDAVALYRQLDEKSYKVSLRSSGDIDVESVARSFGGGGHRNAAGFPFTGDRDELEARTLAALHKSLDASP